MTSTVISPTIPTVPTVPTSPNVPTSIDPAAVRTLAAACRERADEIETGRTMPADLVASAKTAGVFRMAMPASLGGIEADPATIVTTIEELAAADGSAGWTALIGNSTAFFAWLDPDVAREMLGGETDIVSTSMFGPIGTARPDGADLVIDGRWPFNSGCPHAEWFQVGITVLDGDGPARRPDGALDTRFAFLRRDDAEVIDTWRSTGLRGTGSHDVAISHLALPATWTASPFTDAPCQDGPLWRLGFWPLISVLMSGFPLGVGRRALDEIVSVAPTKRRGMSPIPVAEDSHFQIELAKAEAGLLAARAFVFETIGTAWDVVVDGDPLDRALGLRVALAGQHAMDAAVAAVDTAFQFAGASAVYSGNPLERCLRDIRTARQHIAFSGMLQRDWARLRTGVA